MLTLALGLKAETDLLKVARKTKTTFDKILQGDPNALLRAANVYVKIMREELARPGSGIIYGEHRASAPGEPPASDTGTLSGAIGVALFGDARTELFAGVTVDSSIASYWRDLEFGTVNMEPRPFVRPALSIGRRGAAAIYITNSRKRSRRIIRQRRGRL